MELMFASCNKEPVPMTREEIRHKTDSLTKVQVERSNEHAKKDLEHRIKIEVKVKVDSILNAKNRKVTKDTVQNTKVDMKVKAAAILNARAQKQAKDAFQKRISPFK